MRIEEDGEQTAPDAPPPARHGPGVPDGRWWPDSGIRPGHDRAQRFQSPPMSGFFPRWSTRRLSATEYRARRENDPPGRHRREIAEPTGGIGKWDGGCPGSRRGGRRRDRSPAALVHVISGRRALGFVSGDHWSSIGAGTDPSLGVGFDQAEALGLSRQASRR